MTIQDDKDITLMELTTALNELSTEENLNLYNEFIILSSKHKEVSLKNLENLKDVNFRMASAKKIVLESLSLDL